MIVRSVRRASAIASAAARRSPETSVMSEASIATSVPVPIASPRSACASAGASLIPSPTIATTSPCSCRRRISATFSSGIDLGEHALDADLGGDALGVLPAVAGEQDGSQAEPLSSATASALVGLTVSRTASVALGRPSHATTIAPSRRPTSTACPSTTPGDADAGDVPEVGHRRKLADLGAEPPRPRPDRSGAPTPPPRRRPATAPPRGSRRRAAPRRRAPSFPSVTVPVLSRTTVVIRRVCSRTSGPLIRMPSCAPRPVPTMSAVGVARPSAHGHAMISTATAAENASVASPGDDQPADQRGEREPEDDRDEDAPRRGRRAAGSAPSRPAPRRRGGRSARAPSPRRPSSRGRRGARTC